jgi:hypothetical protein
MHHTHQPSMQIWAHPLPNGHPTATKGRSTTFETKKTKRRIKIMDEG